MKKLMYVVGLSGFLLVNAGFAADIPTVVQGAQKYDRQNCTQEYSQNCINNSCLNSEQLDCQDNCRRLAQDKCRQQANE